MTYLFKHFVGIGEPYNYLAFLVFALVVGQIFSLGIVVFKWCQKFELISDIMLFPIVMTSCWSLYPFILFPAQLADSQTEFLISIQAVDITGVFGLNFMIFLSNYLIFHCFISREVKIKNKYFVFGVFLLLLWFGYGFWSLRQWDHKISTWERKKFGFVQPNRKATLGAKYPDKGYSWAYPWELEMTEKLTSKGAEIVIWPEGHFYRYAFLSGVRKAFQEKIKELEIALLFQDPRIQFRNRSREVFNSAFFINEYGKESGIYDKNILVPFGERTPLMEYFTWLVTLFDLELSDLTPGKTQTLFSANDFKIVPLICYENVFPLYVGEAVGENGKGKIIISGSQAGWYNSIQLVDQFNHSTLLRAVENRVPLVHVIVNGESIMVSPNGRIVHRSDYKKRGAWIGYLPYDPESGGSFFSEHPYFFIRSLQVFLFLLISYCWYLSITTDCRF